MSIAVLVGWYMAAEHFAAASSSGTSSDLLQLDLAKAMLVVGIRADHDHAG